MNKKYTTILLATILPLILIIIIIVASLYNINITTSQGGNSSGTEVPTAEFTQRLKASKSDFDKSMTLFKAKDYINSKKMFEAVVIEDKQNYTEAQARIAECVNYISKDYISKVKELLNKTHYTKAQQVISEALNIIPNDIELTALMDEAKKASENPVVYKGKIYHVFFHSLIVYPELCFTGDSMTQGYNDWMTTVREFKLMIEEMYQRGYTLVDLRELFKKDASGKMLRQDLYLPEGQKPLVISVDDMSYYKYMEKDGFAKRLVLDGKGELASLINTPKGEEIVSPDGDVVPILNNFVALNPDFSYKGAKGTLALTGYEGILGYRTNHDNPSWEEEKESVIPIVNKLKETGWAFASHSYTHRRTFAEGTITLDFLKYDTQRWKAEVGSILGATNIYISPFGAEFSQKDARFRYIVDQGFDVYCGVGARAYFELHKDNAYMERIDLDGYKMIHSPNVLKDLFNVEKILDPARPSFK
ncbi:MAG: polysaccharide deacetylase family protein [Ruminiclostridium sp.]